MLFKIRLGLKLVGILKDHKGKIAAILLSVLAIPGLLIAGVIALFSWMNWGDEAPQNYEPYKKIGYEEGIAWQELFVIDLVIHDMDQEDLEPGKLVDYFVYYVKQVITVVDKDGKEHQETIEVKMIRTFDEVMSYLNFTDEQREMAKDSLALIYEQTGTGGGFGTGAPISEVGAKEIPAQYIPIYKAAEAKYGVPWNLLAAEHRVETVFSTISPMISKVGAEGHMQFMPCTFIGWRHPSCSGAGKGNFTDEEKTSLAAIAKYGGVGVDGDGDGKADMWNIWDAIFSAAHYLAMNGAADGKMREAVYAYNHSQKYVDDVMAFANSYADGGYTPIDLPPTNSGFARPVSGPVTSGFGPRVHPVTGEVGKPHMGIDFACTKGQPIPASRAGTVVAAGWEDASNPKKGYGQFVWVDHGGGYKTTYAHLSAINVRVGDKVQAGGIVGACGSTGSSTGYHLHFEIFVNGERVNPGPFIGL